MNVSERGYGFHEMNFNITERRSRNGDRLLWLAFFFTLTYIVLSYLSPATLFPGLAKKGLVVGIAAAAALTCFHRVAFHPTLWRSPYPYLMLGLTASVAISRISSFGVWEAVREFLSSSIVFFLAIAALDKISQIRIFGFVVALLALFLLTQCFYNWNGREARGPRLYWQQVEDSQGHVIKRFPRLESVGFLADANDFAQFLLIAMSLLTLAWKPRKHARNIVFVALPMLYLLYGVHATYSRGGMIGLAVLTFCLSNIKFNKSISLMLAGVVLAASLLTYPAGPKVVSPHERSAGGRIQAWDSGITMFQSSPIFGIGFERFGQYNGRAAHNSLVQCLAELGIVGCLFWLSMIVFALADLTTIAKSSTPEIRYAAYAVRTALITFLVTAWFLSRSYTMTLYVLLGMAVAIQMAFSGQARISGGPYLKRWVLTMALATVGLVALRATIHIWNAW
jgi:hypothetical protein